MSGFTIINIYTVSKTKFLGVLIDVTLTWKDQFNNVDTNLSRISGVMYTESHVLGITGLLTICYSLFLPVLYYCCEIWGNACITKVNCDTVVQQVIRTMC